MYYPMSQVTRAQWREAWRNIRKAQGVDAEPLPLNPADRAAALAWLRSTPYADPLYGKFSPAFGGLKSRIKVKPYKRPRPGCDVCERTGLMVVSTPFHVSQQPCPYCEV